MQFGTLFFTLTCSLSLSLSLSLTLSLFTAGKCAVFVGLTFITDCKHTQYTLTFIRCFHSRFCFHSLSTRVLMGVLLFGAMCRLQAAMGQKVGKAAFIPDARPFLNGACSLCLAGLLRRLLTVCALRSCTCSQPGYAGGSVEQLQPGRRGVRVELGHVSDHLPKRPRPQSHNGRN